MAGEVKFKEAIEAKPMVGDYIIKKNGDVLRVICGWDNDANDKFYLLNERSGYIEDYSEANCINDLLFDIEYVRVVRNKNTVLEEI